MTSTIARVGVVSNDLESEKLAASIVQPRFVLRTMMDRAAFGHQSTARPILLVPTDSTFANDSTKGDAFHLPTGAIIGIVFGVVLLLVVLTVKLLHLRRRYLNRPTSYVPLEECVVATESAVVDVKMTPVFDAAAYASLIKLAAERHCRLASFIYDCEGHGESGNFRLAFASLRDCVRLSSDFRFMHIGDETSSMGWEDETASSRFDGGASDEGTICVLRESLCRVCVVEYVGENATSFRESLMVFATLEMDATTAFVVVHVAKDPQRKAERLRFMEELKAERENIVSCSSCLYFALESELMWVDVTVPEHLERTAKMRSIPGKKKFVARQMRNVCQTMVSGDDVAVNGSQICIALELTEPVTSDRPFVADVTCQTACEGGREDVLGQLTVHYCPPSPAAMTSSMPPVQTPGPPPPSSSPCVLLSSLGGLLGEGQLFLRSSWREVAAKFDYTIRDVEQIVAYAHARRSFEWVEFLCFHLKRVPSESAERLAGLLSALNADADLKFMKQVVRNRRFQLNEVLVMEHRRSFQDLPSSSTGMRFSPVPTNVPSASSPRALAFSHRASNNEMGTPPSMDAADSPTYLPGFSESSTYAFLPSTHTDTFRGSDDH